jgi:putative NADH-flavin reductase
MNLIVFGATGMIGKQLVQQALHNGHNVKAFGRNVFSSFETDIKNLELIKGALFDANEVQKAIKGCDAVLSALDGGPDSNDKTRTLGLKNIIAQMKTNNVKRIVAVGDSAILNNAEGVLLMDTEDFPKELLPTAMEQRQAFQYLKESGLHWTLVCPAQIIDHDATGSFTTAADHLPAPNNDRINSGDLALLMLKEMQQNKYVQQRVGISN